MADVRYGKIIDAEDAVNKICNGSFNIYNRDIEFLVFPDLVEDDDEDYADLFQVESGDRMYGFQTCHLPWKKAKEIIEKRDSLEMYARESYPTPGFLDVGNKSDIEDYIYKLFDECPEGWIYEEFC